MPAAMTLISSQTLGSTATSVTFSSIASGFRDLRLVITGTITAGTVDAIVARYNGDTASNYSVVWATGDGTTASSSTQATTYVSLGVMGNGQSVSTVDILDYAQTDKHKTSISRGNQPGWGTRMNAGRWASTSAITSILIYMESASTFSAGDSFYLYGILG